MRLIKGRDMFLFYEGKDMCHVLCITTNGICKNNGAGDLVMGAGVAGAAAKKWPWLPAMAGNVVRVHGTRRHDMLDSPWDYGLANVAMPDRMDVSIMLVQTKYHYRDPSPPQRVAASIDMLRIWAENSLKRSDMRFHLPFPGIGYGGLPRSLVLPWVETLPDNVFVYEL